MYVPVQDLPNLNTNESNLVNICHIIVSHMGCKVSSGMWGGFTDMKNTPPCSNAKKTGGANKELVGFISSMDICLNSQEASLLPQEQSNILDGKRIHIATSPWRRVKDS